MDAKTIFLAIVLAPLLGAILAGLFRNVIGRVGAHCVTIAAVTISTVLSWHVLLAFWSGSDAYRFDQTIYTLMEAGGIRFEIGFLIDGLSALMMMVVTSVSLMVHFYTIGYMRDDPGYQRFFSYISLFTFAMLTLVMANNFTQLFFGWEAVGLVSYLLIGFWFERESAVKANLKAFLVNRVGDLGFLLGIGLVLAYLGTLNYSEAFAAAGPDSAFATAGIFLGADTTISVATLTCLLLFVGAMGKSAQVPLHVWLPDSMEGPTPISALIHAATMVTAGIYMVARLSPLFELSETALSTILVIGATTAFFMGLIGIVQNDIKRVVAYSTLSQLGYMTVALGVSAYSVAIFHLATHAFFKALLFLAAGSVIVGLHHVQDLRSMGGLRRFMPWTCAVAWIGTLALVGFPGTSGFFSKDLIIEAVHHSSRWGSGYAYALVLAGVAVTSLYSFRLLYLAFHGSYRGPHQGVAVDDHDHAGHGSATDHERHLPHESPWVIVAPLVLLAIPSLVFGLLTVDRLIFGDFFSGVLAVPSHGPLAEISSHYHGPAAFALHGLQTPAFWLMVLGFGLATWLFLFQRSHAELVAKWLKPIGFVLRQKYGFDQLYDRGFAGLGMWVGRLTSNYGDRLIIDGAMVNGSATVIGMSAARLRRLQTGFLYDYALLMIVGVAVLVSVFVFRA